MEHTLLCAEGDTIRLELRSDEKSKAERFPFDFVLTSTFRLEGRTAHHTLTVTNPADAAEELQFGIGYHPAFRIPFDDQHTTTDYEFRFDQPESPSVRTMLLGANLIQFVLVISLAATAESSSMVVRTLLYGASITMLMLMIPFVNSLGMETIRQGEELDYGIGRGMGSVAYAIASWLLGRLTASFGADMISIWAIALTILFLACVFRFPFKKDRKKAEAEKEETGAAGPVDFLKRYPSFAVVLLGCILIFMSHSLINSFNYQIAMAKGGGSGEMGNAMTISAVSELPTMFLFGYLLKKKSSVFWFRLSGLFFVLKSIGTFLAFNIPTYYAAQPFQMFGWALINVACVYYVNGIMEPQDSIKGQAYMAMTITAGNVMSSLFGGWLIDAAGVGAMLICASLAAFIGWLIVCLGSKEAKTA